MMHTIGNVAPAGILREGNPEGRLRTRHLRWDEAQWDEGSWVRYLVLLVFPRDADERREGHPAVLFRTTVHYTERNRMILFRNSSA